MARRRFQSGWLFKSGKRRKVWIGRWREDALLPDGTIGEIRRSAVLGLVAEIPTRREAQLLLDAKLLPVNQGTPRPEAFVAFGAFVEQQWKTLVFPDVQGVNAARLSNRAERARAPGMARLATSRHRAPRDSAMGRGQVPSRHGLADGPECVGTALQHSRNGGRIRISPNEPARGVKFPQKGLKKKPALIAGDSSGKAARARRRTVSDDGETHRRDGTENWRAVGASLVGARSRGRHAWRCANRCSRASSSCRKRRRRCERFRSGAMP